MSFREFVKALLNPKFVPAVVVTLDALGTLYRFREPVSKQYIRVAQQCGLHAKLDPAALDKSFRSSFKHYNAQYPNYGKGRLESPEEWWTKVVNRAFSGLVAQDKIPKDLGTKLYHHFSSGVAYELYPDVKPFLQSIRALKSRYDKPEGPLVVTGVVSNSDPRVRLVLEDLGLRTGPSEPVGINLRRDFAAHLAAMRESTGPRQGVLPFARFYNPRNDLDFLWTSYQSSHDKPDAEIWHSARRSMLSVMPVARSEASFLASSESSQVTPAEALRQGVDLRFGEVMWIHIGDDYSRDFVGAKRAGLNALLLKRDEVSSLLHKDDGIDDADASTVTSLEEAAMVVNVMAQEHLAAVES